MIWIGVFNYFALKNVWRKDKLQQTGLGEAAADAAVNEKELLLAGESTGANEAHIV